MRKNGHVEESQLYSRLQFLLNQSSRLGCACIEDHDGPVPFKTCQPRMPRAALMGCSHFRASRHAWFLSSVVQPAVRQHPPAEVASSGVIEQSSSHTADRVDFQAGLGAWKPVVSGADTGECQQGNEAGDWGRTASYGSSHDTENVQTRIDADQ